MLGRTYMPCSSKKIITLLINEELYISITNREAAHTNSFHHQSTRKWVSCSLGARLSLPIRHSIYDIVHRGNNSDAPGASFGAARHRRIALASARLIRRRRVGFASDASEVSRRKPLTARGGPQRADCRGRRLPLFLLRSHFIC